MSRYFSHRPAPPGHRPWRPGRLVGAAAAAAIGVAGLVAPAGASAAEPAPTATPAPGPVTVTTEGLVRGTTQNGVTKFQGLPYAAPPVGDLRWQPPQPPAKWRGVRDASKPGSPCVQQAYASSTPTSPGSEDCLYLNVTVPAADKRKLTRPKPVIVWIHGGGYAFGQGDIYDATRVATFGDVVVVSLNYRLGALGFLADPALGTADRTAGNYGLLDQQAALRWVKRNVLAFGGDPLNVTIAGESAGAGSVCSHLIAPSSKHLFDKTIQQSGSCIAPFTAQPAAEATGQSFTRAAGCTDAATAAACLRALPAEKLAELGGSTTFNSAWGPVAQSTFLPQQPAEAIAAGAGKGKPRLLGNNASELTIFLAASVATGGGYTPATFEATVRAQFGAGADKVLAAYPLSEYANPTAAYAQILSDATVPFLSSCGHLATARTYKKSSPLTYLYSFTDPQPPGHDAVPGLPLGAYHSAELPYIWGLPRGLVGGPPVLTAEQQALSTQMIQYWTAFARTGTPNLAPGPRWPVFRDADDVLQLAPASAGGVKAIDLAKAAKCDLWRSLGQVA